ncbi:MAG: hypothetical protein ACNYPG_01960 [Candidatus Porifericomitaceae bacterium WSBS_2022_MAG_OTU9]
MGQVQKQIGNAVPVKLAEAIAKEVSKYFRLCNKATCLYIFIFYRSWRPRFRF